LPNGVDVRRFSTKPARRLRARRELGIPRDAQVALFVGNLTHRKGVAVLLDAWQAFIDRRRREDSPARLVLVGPGSDGDRESSSDVSRRVLSDTARDDTLRYLDHLPVEAMPDVYAAADLFVLPTQAEGMPNSLLEALAAGLPVIVPRVPGITEVLDGQPGTGVLLDTPTVDAIRCSLERLLNEDGLSGCRHDATRLPPQMTLDHVAEAYLELYTSLAGHGGERRAGALRRTIERVGQPW
jgi:glycosyltransferase involved in cell wall biosynthesis